jgi:hypothetical protein
LPPSLFELDPFECVVVENRLVVLAVPVFLILVQNENFSVVEGVPVLDFGSAAIRVLLTREYQLVPQAIGFSTPDEKCFRVLCNVKDDDPIAEH